LNNEPKVKLGCEAFFDFQNRRAYKWVNGERVLSNKLIQLDPEKGGASRVLAMFPDNDRLMLPVQGIWWRMLAPDSTLDVVRPVGEQKKYRT
jgi:hypothetical protein